MLVVIGTDWVSFTNKTDRHDIAEILLKVALNTINQTEIPRITCYLTIMKLLVMNSCLFWYFRYKQDLVEQALIFGDFKDMMLIQT
jgi:hypothetical protein